MTVAAKTPSKEYIENGVTTSFAVPLSFQGIAACAGAAHRARWNCHIAGLRH